MLRPTLLLSATLFATLLIAGEDRGQLRPGLEEARASGTPATELTRSFSPTVSADPAPAPEKALLSDLPPPVEMIEAPAIGTLPEAAPETAPEEPGIFTLSALTGSRGEISPLNAPGSADPAALSAAPPPPAAAAPAESSLYADPTDGGQLSAAADPYFTGQGYGDPAYSDPAYADQAYADPAYADPAYTGQDYTGQNYTGQDYAARPFAGEAPGPGFGADLRMVQASSANVRLSPSTESEVVGRLYSGEVVTVVGEADAEWVEVLVEGDGIYGYVSARLLSPLAN